MPGPTIRNRDGDRHRLRTVIKLKMGTSNLEAASHVVSGLLGSQQIFYKDFFDFGIHLEVDSAQ